MRIATCEEIKSGKTTDIYFERTREILEALNVHKRVTVDIKASSLPGNYGWAIAAGIYDAVSLLDGMDVEVDAVEEGTVFGAGEPIMQITGDYLDFCVLETAILGYLCQQSGIATKAARCKKAAQDNIVISFGARRMHPALAAIIERNAYIGGCDGVSIILAGELMGFSASGTMPHSLIIMLGNVSEAIKRFDEIIDPTVPRVALVDTFCDEKLESIQSAETIGNRLFGVRLDTPGSRRGNMAKILEEVRWELDIRGYKDVQLIVSGGIDEQEILELNPYADGYGVGTAISNAKTIDLALDIVEIEGKPIAKRGKKSGRKQIMQCGNCFHRKLVLYSSHESQVSCSLCGHKCNEILLPAARDGKTIMSEKSPAEIRTYVLEQLNRVDVG